jgi:CHAT domain-containing protein
MTTFYQGLARDMARGEALREAQREMERRGAGVHSWGAFVLQGDPGKLGVKLARPAG